MKTSRLNVNFNKNFISRGLFKKIFWLLKNVIFMYLVLIGKLYLVWNVHYYLCSLFNVIVSGFFFGIFKFVSLSNTNISHIFYTTTCLNYVETY